MSDSFENLVGLKGSNIRPCRVAYTLNNEQPVLCTIIGDQPLFYMDFEDDFGEEEYFDESEFAVLDEEIRNVKRQIDDFDRFYSGLELTPGAVVKDFFENAKDFGAPNLVSETSYEDLLQTLSLSRFAQAFLDCLSDNGGEIQFSEQVNRSFYDRKNGNILLNPQLEKADLVLACIYELRTHWQHRQGALIHPLLFHPDNAILINRTQVADRVVAMVRAAWELQLAGEKSVWENLENSSMGDLARSFAREAYLDFRTINNGIACAAVFESWFLSERCRHQDKELIQQMLADYQGYVFENGDDAKGLTADLIAALGEMPYGKNYLAQHAGTIMSDPIFTDVRDRSNANFLWFIKFERTFRESEQELQNSSGLTHEGSLHASSNIDQKECRHGQEKELIGKSANVVRLFPGQNWENESDSTCESESGKILARTNNRGAQGSDANIIFLHRNPTE